MKPTVKLSGAFLIGALGLTSCVTDELQEANTGEAITFTSQVSRATPTTLKNLDGFYIYADAQGYTNMFLSGKKVTKEGAEDSNIYVLDEKVTWPSDVDKISFWGYGPLDANTYLKPEISAQSQNLNNFKVAASWQTGGKDQKDFVVTFAEAEKKPGNQVPLEFHHALSQIELKAKIGANPETGRRVYIKGAWFVNINSAGDLRFKSDAAAEYHHMNWTGQDMPTYYGCYLGTRASLSSSESTTIIGDVGGVNTSLMLIPQEVNKYVFPSANVLNDDLALASDQKPGAYILVLCRIETHHNTAVTDDGQAKNPAIKPDPDNQGHTHQLYPIIKDSEGNPIYKDEAYGYVCVPVDINWVPGRKYVYTLEFCGRGSGAGQYAPTDIPDVLPNDDNNVNNPDADGKKPGDYVLDNEISFSVTVSAWTEVPVENKMH